MLGARIFRRLLCAMSAVVVFIVLAPLFVMTNAARAATECPRFEFVGGRGSGQSPQGDGGDYSAGNQYGMGPLLYSVYDQLAGLVGRDQISAYGVHYPSVGIAGSFGEYVNGTGAFLHIKPLGSYTDSVRAGTADTLAHIRDRRRVCGDTTRFILTGYSQGAQAVGDALQSMTAQERASVAAAAFFGDPYFNARSASSRATDADHYGLLGVRDEWPADMSGKIFSYCRPHDPICGISKRTHIIGDGDLYYRDIPWFQGFGPHSEYDSSGDAADAARQLARVVGAPTPRTGSVPLDLIFTIDTTGSMGGVIGQVRDNVTALTQSIASTSSDYRFALVDYKDGPEQGDPYRARVDLPFTTSAASFSTAAATLNASGGGDIPESVYSGVMTALNMPWRAGVRKVVIAIGDAPGKDPEPGTGYTLDQVRARALAVDPAQVYTVATSSSSTTTSFLTALATATDGKFSLASTTQEFVDTLRSTIVAAGSAPVAKAGGPYTGIAGEPIALSGGGSRDESTQIVAYDWDFDGDGTYDATTPSPVTEHVFPAAESYSIVMRARSALGLSGVDTATVTVTDPPRPPTTPRSLTATPADGRVTLAWTDGGGGSTTWYTVYDGAGHVIDRISAATGATAVTWIDQALVNGTPQTYRVTAGNPAGESTAAGPVTATPTGSTAPPTVPSLWATSTTATAIDIAGSGFSAGGRIHSEGGIRIIGTGITLRGGTEYVTIFTATPPTGTKATPSPTTVAAGLGTPPVPNIADYRPDGPVAGSGVAYRAIDATACVRGVWTPTNLASLSGVVYVPCAVVINGNRQRLNATIAAEGTIRITATNTQIGPDTPGSPSLISAARSPDAIVIAASGVSLRGTAYAPFGSVRVTGSATVFECGVIASTITVKSSGASAPITARCGSGS